MRTYILNQKHFIFILVALLITFSTKMSVWGQDLNAGEPRTVRLIYFLPNDRPYEAKVVQKMKDEVRTVQIFFAEQMKAHGYGNKTFRFETDGRGNPLVLRVDGQHPFSYYKRTLASPVLDEVRRNFDFSANIYFMVLGGADASVPGVGGRHQTRIGIPKYTPGGFALVPSEFSWSFVAHEMGHAFGLLHDFRNDDFIMSYGTKRRQLSACAAEFLAVHPYFNPDIPFSEPPIPSVKLISPITYPVGLKSVPIRLRITPFRGALSLYQVFLHVQGNEVRECRRFAGEKDVVVEFEYDGIIPPEGTTNLYDPPVHQFGVTVVDTNGNIFRDFFRLSVLSSNFLYAFDHRNQATSVSFSPDGTTLAAGHATDVKLWDLTTRTLIAIFPNGSINSTFSVLFSPDGKTLAVGLTNGHVKLINVATQTEVATIKGYKSFVMSLSFSPDGKTLAVGLSDGKVQLWDVATQTEIITLGGHASTVSVAFSPNGRILATGSLDNTIKLWDVRSWQPIAPLKGSRSKLTTRAVSFSPDGKILATGSGQIELWDMDTRNHIATLPGHIRGISDLSFSPDGAILASAGRQDFAVKLWDVETRVNVATFNGHTNVINSISFSPDGTIVASAANDYTVKLWDLSEFVKPRLKADVNGDGFVNILDLVAVVSAFGTAEPDLNGDGVVNILDLVIVANAMQ